MLEPRPLLCIAHRGGRAHGTENALGTIAKALELGVDAVEIDVWLVGGKVLVTHDRRLGRVIKGEGRLLDVAPDQIETLRHYDDSAVASLEEVVELIGSRALLNVEIKGPGTAPRVAEILRDYCRQSQVSTDNYAISSFDHQQLHWLQQHAPELPRAVLVGSIPLTYAEVGTTLGARSFNPSIDFVNQALVNDARQRGMDVWVYTANEEDEFAELSAMGVTGVFTDFPERLIEWNRKVARR